MKLKLPEIVDNVYRDMRDRRLISIAIALVVAIIAVPFLLGGGGADDGAGTSSAASGTAAAAPIDGSEQVDPVVLTDVPGLRDFRERLDRYKSRNPFKQQLIPAPTGVDDDGSSDESSTSGQTLETQESAAAGTDPAAVGDIGGLPTEPEAIPSSDPVPSDPPAAAATPGPKEPTGPTELITYRLDVRVGPIGDTRVQRGVKSLEFLPDRREPIVQYVESDVDGRTASFIVAPDAVTLPGDGRCGPSRKRCEFLLMKVGDDQTFQYGDDGVAYRLQLLDIDRHSEPLRKSGAPRERGASRERGAPSFSSVTGASSHAGR